MSTTRAPATALDGRLPVRVLLLLGALAALGPASLDIHLPALPTLADDLGTPSATAQATVSVFLVSIGTGQLILGPLSDGLGRRRPLLVALLVYAAASVVCATAPSVGILLGARLVQGLAAAAGTVIGRAVIRDVAAGAAGARYLSRLVLIYGLAPVLAPFVGGQLLALGSWRWLFVALAAAGVALCAASAAILPETHPPARRVPVRVGATAATFAGLLRIPRFRAYALAVGFGTGATVAYLSGSPFALENVYGVSPQLVGLVIGITGTAMIAGSQANARLLARHEPGRLLAAGVAAFVGIGAALVVLTATGAPLWLVAPFMFGLMACWGFIPSNAVALAMQDHPLVAGAASALLGASQYGLAAIAAPLVGLGGEHSAVPMAVVILLLASLTVLALWTARRAGAGALAHEVGR